MGRIVSNFFMSLDGVVESPEHWHLRYFDDEMGAVIGRAVQTTRAFLMGRVLYEQWSAYWPERGADDEFAGFINNIPKYVVSSSLRTAAWSNTTIVSGDVPGQLRAIKDGTDGDISISGSATLVRSLLGAGLIDELHLLVHPVLVGHGARLFEHSATQPLELVAHTVLGTGVLDLTYAPAAD